MTTTDKKTRSKSSFEASRGNIFNMRPEDLVLVEDEAHPLYDPRVHRNPEPGLVANIMARGVLKPILIRKNGTSAEVVDGRQRVKAALEANKRIKAEGGDIIMVPCMVKRGDDVDMTGVMIAANIRTEEETIIEKAKKAQRLLDKGKSHAQVARDFGVEANTIRTWVKVLDLAPPVQKAIAAGEISETDGVRKLINLPREEQASALEEMRKNGTTVEGAIKKRGGKIPKSRPGVSRTDLRKLVQSTMEEEGKSPWSQREEILLRWLVGKATVGDVCEAIPRLTPFVTSSKKKAAA